MTLRLIIACTAVCLFGSVGAHAQTMSKKPKPPPGVDPGGIAVAIIGSGIDYRRPDIARRLARDGEGTIIAWDLIDNDPLPLEVEPSRELRLPLHAGTEPALWLLREAPAARLIAVRAIDADLQSLGTALNFARSTPARIAVVLLNEAPADIPQALFALIAASPKLLVIVPSTTAQKLSPANMSAQLQNLISVSAVTTTGSRIAGHRTPPATDVAAPVPDSMQLAPLATSLDADVAIANAAAIRVAALAARLLKSAPHLDAAALRIQLGALASPGPTPAIATETAAPWLANIENLPAPR